MKKILIISILAILTLITGIATAQNYPDEYLGLPGDNLNLYATMKLFQESETLESFEKSLNDENSRINNLDLNGDNQVDYIMVIDYVDGDVHSIVMRAALSRDETQDVAVFTVQRFNDGTVEIQLVGDEALYGKNYIVEPIFANNESETPNPGYTVNNRNIAVVRTTTYEIATWPVVRYIYLPNYVTWHSSWHWGYYPHYWNPWRPYYWHTYYGYHYNMHNHYYSHYRIWNHHRCRNYNSYYYNNIRTYSHNVRTRIDKGYYKNTYSRPDLRRSGDVFYARNNSGNNSRTRTTASADSRGINSKSAATRTTERALVTNTSNRATSSVNRGNENSRKSATVSNTRTVKSSSVGQNRGNNQRSSANVSSRNASRTPAANSSSVSSRNSSGQSKTKSAMISRSSGNQPRKAVSTRSSGSSNRSSGSVSRSSGSSNRSSSSVSRSSGSSNRSSGSVSRSSGGSNRSSGAKSSQSRSSSSSRSGRR